MKRGKSFETLEPLLLSYDTGVKEIIVDVFFYYFLFVFDTRYVPVSFFSHSNSRTQTRGWFLPVISARELTLVLWNHSRGSDSISKRTCLWPRLYPRLRLGTAVPRFRGAILLPTPHSTRTCVIAERPLNRHKVRCFYAKRLARAYSFSTSFIFHQNATSLCVAHSLRKRTAFEMCFSFLFFFLRLHRRVVIKYKSVNDTWSVCVWRVSKNKTKIDGKNAKSLLYDFGVTYTA